MSMSLPALRRGVGQRQAWNGMGVREGLKMPSRSSERLELLAIPEYLGDANQLAELPALEGRVLRAIDAREAHLSRLHALLLSGCGHVPDNPAGYSSYAPHLAAVRREAAEELRALRLASIDTVESIVRWRRRRRVGFEPFVWRSHNYLLKMLLDIFFLGVMPTVADATADPFLLRVFTETLSMHTRNPIAATEVAAVSGEQGDAAAARSSAHARRRQLCRDLSPQRQHTKHELMRMWAAERVLEAERAHLGAAFEPVSPVLQPADVEVRRMAALIWLGVGEPPALVACDPKMRAQPRAKVEQPDPAMKPPPPVNPRHKATVEPIANGTMLAVAVTR